MQKSHGSESEVIDRGLSLWIIRPASYMNCKLNISIGVNLSVQHVSVYLHWRSGRLPLLPWIDECMDGWFKQQLLRTLDMAFFLF